MKKQKLYLFLGICLFLIFPSWLKADPVAGDFKARIGFLFTDFQSNLQYDTNIITGTKLNLRSDLDLDHNQVVPFVEAWFGGRFALNLAYMDSKYEGKALKSTKITYNGITLTDGLSQKQVTVDIDFRTADIAVQLNPIFSDKLQAGGIAGVKYFYYKNRIVNTTDNIAVNSDEEILIPYYGGEVILTPIRYLSFHLRLRGSSYQWSAVNIDRGIYLDFELGATLRFTKYIGFTVEYRYFEVRVTKESSSKTSRFVNTFDAVVFSLMVQI